MDENLNILILSCGSRNKIVEYFKKELSGKGKVIATDCSELAPALYEADKFYIVPKISDDNYLETVLNICKDENINSVISLIDPELTILAENKQRFLDIGTFPIVSDLEIVEMSFNKYNMYEFLLENELPTVKSYIKKEDFYKDVEFGRISYPVFVKPIKGSASLNINFVSSKEEIELLFSRYENLMIQEYMNGTEYGADVYIDIDSNEPVTIFLKEKIRMKGGETDKSVSIKIKEVFDLIIEFTKKVKFKGVIDIDIFKFKDSYYISEVNPRFGGGYPHAYECGVNIPKMIVKNMNNKRNKNVIGEYEENIYMMKYNEVKIWKK